MADNPRWIVCSIQIILFIASNLSVRLVGRHRYVKRVISKLPGSQLHLSTPVTAISTTPHSSKVTLQLPTGTEEFDHVILATHSDTSLKMLQNGSGMTANEEAILGSFAWNQNRAVLHTDVNVSR